MLMKKSNDTIGNRIRNISACSSMSQANAQPPAPEIHVTLVFFHILFHSTASSYFSQSNSHAL
jgi:hypothetical protein